MRNFTWLKFGSVVLPLLLAGQVRAAGGDTVVKIGHCKTKQGEFSLLSDESASLLLPDKAELSVMSSDKDVVTGLNQVTGGTFHRVENRIELPGYWKPQFISLADCQMSRTPPSNRWLFRPGDVDIPMYLQSYFVSEWPGPWKSLDDMLRDHSAFRVKIHAICTANPADGDPTSDPLGCHKVRILDQQIPVDPRAGGLNARFGLGPPVEWRLNSALCSNPAEKLASGAVAITWQNKIYFITSAYAVSSQRGEDSCSEITDGAGHIYKLNLISQDYAMGLALLQPLSAERLPGLALATTSPEDLPDVAKLRGGEVEILAARSDRHFIPKLDQAMEILSPLSVDAASVGAPLVDDKNAVLGIVSHEYLRIFPGNITRPLRWRRESGETSDHLVVIPARAIGEWLDGLAKAEPKIWTSPGPASRDPAALSFQSGRLDFTESCPAPGKSQPGGPIGGMDPVGVGGDSANFQACKITLHANSESDGRFFLPGLQTWHDDAVRRLAVGNTIELQYVIWRDGDLLSRDYFYSSESFFKQLARFSSGRSIVEIVHRPDGATGLEPRLDALRGMAESEGLQAKQLYDNNTLGDPAAAELLRRLYLLTTVLKSEQWKLVAEADFQKLTGKDYAFAWKVIQLVDTSHSLRNQLETLRAAWTKLK